MPSIRRIKTKGGDVRESTLFQPQSEGAAQLIKGINQIMASDGSASEVKKGLETTGVMTPRDSARVLASWKRTMRVLGGSEKR